VRLVEPSLQAKDREGLCEIVENGIFETIWQKHHTPYLKAARLPHRKMLKLHNASIPDYTALDNPDLWIGFESR